MVRRAIIFMATLVITGSARAGSTRCWIDQGAIVAAASFGDIAGDFIIDVGAPLSELHVTRAEADGMDSDGFVRPLALAGHRLSVVRMTVANLDALPQTDTSIAGIIGADVLSRHPVTIAFDPCLLTWGGLRRVRATKRLPIRLIAGVPTVEATVSDGVITRTDSLIVSTGRTETLVSDATLSRKTVAGSFAPIRLRAVVIGGRLVEQIPGGLAGEARGSIGTGVWRGWTSIHLDFKRGWLALTPRR